MVTIVIEHTAVYIAEIKGANKMNTFPNCTQKTTLGIMYEVNHQNKRLIIDTDNQGVQQ